MNLDPLRHWWHTCRQYLHRWRLMFLHYLAEHEALTLRAGKPAPWRRRQLSAHAVTFGLPFYIGRGFWLHDGRNFHFGQRCSFGEFARIMDHGSITVGDDFIAATGLQINSGTHDPSTMLPQAVPIQIGHRVWCGANVSIIAGANIGDDVVIGAGALVRSPIPSGSIAVGVPARVIRKLERNGKESLQWHLSSSA
jgi:maltose O-acetyltransferase